MRAPYSEAQWTALKASICVVALTATATTTVRRMIVESLGLGNYGLIEESPECSNIKYCMLLSRWLKPNFEGIFKWIAQEIEEKGLFCTSVNPSRMSVNCALYFDVFFQRSHTHSLICIIPTQKRMYKYKLSTALNKKMGRFEFCLLQLRLALASLCMVSIMWYW